MENRTRICRKIISDISESNNIAIRFLVRVDNSVDKAEARSGGLALSPGYIDRFTMPELAFVIGHEMAHLLYNHTGNHIALAKITQYIGNRIGEVRGKKLQPDTIFLNAIGQRFEHEADLLGASMANKAGYKGEGSALKKMDKGIFSIPGFADEHPFIKQRLRFLKENPYPDYDKKKVAEEKILLEALSIKIMDGDVSPEDFSLMCNVEAWNISQAHVSLVETRQFLENRKRSIKEALSVLTFSENLNLYRSFSVALGNYDDILKNNTDVATIRILRDDAKEIFREAEAIQKEVGKNFRVALKNSARNIVSKIKGEEREL